MLDLVELGSQARKKPAQLSGGQQQRVALARALINSPDVLLLDEPLGALDLKLRRSMQIEIKRIQTEVGRTFIHVTHDQEEAMTMADTVAVMNAGGIEQMGAPSELYENPRSTFVANFLGQSNLIEGTITSRAADVVSVDMHGIAVSIPTDRAHAPGDRGWVGIRPEKVLIGDVGEALDAPGNTIPGGVVSDVSFVGVSTQYLVRMPWGQELQVFSQNTGRTRIFDVGDKVELSWRPEYAFLLDAAQDAFAGAQRSGRPMAEMVRQAGPDRLPAAAPGGSVAGHLLRHPVLLAGRDQPVRPERLGLARLRHDLPLRQLLARDPGLLGTRWSARWRTAPSRPRSAWCSATCWPTRSRSRPAAGRT